MPGRKLLIVNLIFGWEDVKSIFFVGKEITTIPKPIRIMIRPTRYAKERFSMKF